MEPFVIQVAGRAEIPHPAERALINIVVASSGVNKAAVSDEVITTAKHVETLLRELSPRDDSPEAKKAAALAHWSKTSLSATSQMPWHDGKGPVPKRQYDAKIDFDIRFKDFRALGSFGSRLSALSHVEIPSIRWVLTAATERSYRSRLRKEAARDALQKAHDYCEVLCCKNLRPVELDEPQNYTPVAAYSAFNRSRTGVSYQNVQSAPSFGQPTAGGLFGSQPTEQMTPGGHGQRDESELEFKPETVKMSMELTVKFHADPTDTAASASIVSESAPDDDMDGL